MVIFTEEILNQKSHMLELLKVLRDAMNHEFRGFYLDYQPQVNGRTKALTGVEALVRFCDEKETVFHQWNSFRLWKKKE